MKDFKRDDTLLSLCGLNCGLCSMNLDKYCPGCGGGEGNQTCKIAKCSMQHGKLEYCNQCKEYPCEKYENIDEFDSFITHQNQKKDLEKRQQIGTEAYQIEQQEKIKILKFLLANYNDGRKKTLFCLAVNLLELSELKAILQQIEADEICSLDKKEKAAHVTKLIQTTAEKRQITLKLRKKKAR